MLRPPRSDCRGLRAELKISATTDIGCWFQSPRVGARAKRDRVRLVAERRLQFATLLLHLLRLAHRQVLVRSISSIRADAFRAIQHDAREERAHIREPIHALTQHAGAGL